MTSFPDGRSVGVLAAVGGTPMVELRRLVSSSGARILVKWEPANPTGSMKDRMAVEVIRSAAADGRLEPGGTVVEYTAGTTGISLALVCAAPGYRLHVVFSDAFSVEKRKTMLALGAEISERPGHWWSDQLNNHDGVRAGTFPSARRSGDRPAAGSTRSCMPWAPPTRSMARRAGSARPRHPRGWWRWSPESAVLSGAPTGAHRIEGIGVGFVPLLWQPELVDSIEQVRSDDAQQMARRLAAEEGIFAGTSTGATVIAALRGAEALPSKTQVVTLAVAQVFAISVRRPTHDLTVLSRGDAAASSAANRQARTSQPVEDLLVETDPANDDDLSRDRCQDRSL